jgi:hypothetical protein
MLGARLAEPQRWARLRAGFDFDPQGAAGPKPQHQLFEHLSKWIAWQ